MNFFSKKQIVNKKPDTVIGGGENHDGFKILMTKNNVVYDSILKILHEYFEMNLLDIPQNNIAVMDVEAWVEYFNEQQTHKNIVNYKKIILILDAENIKYSLNLHYVGLQSGLLKYSDCVLWDNYNYETLKSIITITLNEFVKK